MATTQTPFVADYPERPVAGDLLLAEFAAAGLPASGVHVSGRLFVTFPRALTPEEQLAAAGVVAAHAPPPALTPKQALRRAAREALTDDGEPTRIAARNTQRVIYDSIAETRLKVNELVAAVNAALGTSVAPLPVRTWGQALAAVRQRIDAETDTAA